MCTRTTLTTCMYKFDENHTGWRDGSTDERARPIAPTIHTASSRSGGSSHTVKLNYLGRKMSFAISVIITVPGGGQGSVDQID